MHNAIPLIVAALIAVGIIVIGCLYLETEVALYMAERISPIAWVQSTLALGDIP